MIALKTTCDIWKEIVSSNRQQKAISTVVDLRANDRPKTATSRAMTTGTELSAHRYCNSVIPARHTENEVARLAQIDAVSDLVVEEWKALHDRHNPTYLQSIVS